MSINVVEKYNLDMTGATDNSAKLAQMAGDINALFVAKNPLPRLVFSEGIYAFNTWPNLAYSNLQIVADGECHLKHIGIGDAVVFNGPALNPGLQGGPAGMVIDGFILDTGPNTANGFVFKSIHRSYVKVNVQVPAKITGAAVHVVFGILTTYVLTVGGHGNCIGLQLDEFPGHPELPPTANRFPGPILEGCSVGCLINNANYQNFYDGSIEGNGTGIEIVTGGDNHFIGVEMETNAIDINCNGKTAHDNLFWRCGQGSALTLHTNGAIPGTLPGYNNCIDNGLLTGAFGL